MISWEHRYETLKSVEDGVGPDGVDAFADPRFRIIARAVALRYAPELLEAVAQEVGGEGAVDPAHFWRLFADVYDLTHCESLVRKMIRYSDRDDFRWNIRKAGVDYFLSNFQNPAARVIRVGPKPEKKGEEGQA